MTSGKPFSREPPFRHRFHLRSPAGITRNLRAPDRGGLSVGACHATGRASRVATNPLFHTCRRHYPGGTGRCSVARFPTAGSLPRIPRVGCITRFEARSVHIVAARVVAEPPRAALVVGVRRCRYLHRPLRLLPAGATVAGRDSHPLRNGTLSRRTRITHYRTLGGGAILPACTQTSPPPQTETCSRGGSSLRLLAHPAS